MWIEEEISMRISKLLSPDAIDVNASVASKAEAIDYMTRLMEKSGNICWGCPLSQKAQYPLRQMTQSAFFRPVS